MATSKRPALRKHDRVTLSPIKSVIPPYDGKPFVLRDTVLTVSHLTGTGSNRNPWRVVVTDGTHFWHLEPDDVARVEDGGASHHATKKSGGYPDVPLKRERCTFRKGPHRCTFAAVDQGRCNTHPATDAKRPIRHATKKTPAQLQREIDEVLANPSSALDAAITKARTKSNESNRRQTVWRTENDEFRVRPMGERVSPLWWFVRHVPSDAELR